MYDEPEIMKNEEWYKYPDDFNMYILNLIPTDKCPPDVRESYLKWAKEQKDYLAKMEAEGWTVHV